MTIICKMKNKCDSAEADFFPPRPPRRSSKTVTPRFCGHRKFIEVDQVMSTPIIAVRPDEKLVIAARRMRDENIGALAVCSPRGCWGIMTDRDILIRAVAQGRDLETTRVLNVMTPKAVTCQAQSVLGEAGELMCRHKIRRLIVVDYDGNAIGMLTLTDIAQAKDRALTSLILEEVSWL